MDTPPPSRLDAKPPHGFHATRVDDKGRIRIPAKFVEYWEKSGKPELFITSLDGKSARIYFMADWEQMKADLMAKRGEPMARYAFDLASHYGDTATIDGQGRALMPTVLRKELGLENQQVHLLAFGARIDMLTDAAYGERLALARPNVAKMLDDLESWGIG